LHLKEFHLNLAYAHALTFTPPESAPSGQFWGIYALIGGVRAKVSHLSMLMRKFHYRNNQVEARVLRFVESDHFILELYQYDGHMRNWADYQNNQYR